MICIVHIRSEVRRNSKSVEKCKTGSHHLTEVTHIDSRSVLKKLSCSKMGIKVNGEYLCQHRFTDDIVMMAVKQSRPQDEPIENERHDKH